MGFRAEFKRAVASRLKEIEVEKNSWGNFGLLVAAGSSTLSGETYEQIKRLEAKEEELRNLAKRLHVDLSEENTK